MALRNFLLKCRSKIVQILLGNELQKSINLQSDGKLLNSLIRIIPRPSLRVVVISLVEHCNLNCWGCDHYAPLAEESFLSIDEFERDLNRLAELANKGGGISRIELLGGEPLLHPDIHKFTEITRKYFPQTRIEIFTNGILLVKQPDVFWENCRNNRIVIKVTKYPIKINWDIIRSKTQAMNVKLVFSGDTETVTKTSYHIPFDTNGSQNSRINFLNCYHANDCIELYHGHLYTCTIIPHAKHFSKAFGKKLHECETDSINIYDAHDMREILEFLARPVLFCRYCNVLARSHGYPWKQSKREIEEWIII